jgi:hypothetical protein
MNTSPRHILSVCSLHAANEEQERAECKRRHGHFRMQAVRCSKGTIEDISMTGMKVRSRRALRPGGKPRTFVIDLGDGKLRVQGRVMWSARGGRCGNRAGIEFIDLTDEHRDALRMLARGAVNNSTMTSRIYDSVA